MPTEAGVEAYVADALRARSQGIALPFVIRLESDGRVVGATRS